MLKYPLVYLIKSDLFRQTGEVSLSVFLKSLLFTKGFKFVFWLRLAKHFDKNKLLRILPKLMFSYYKRIYVSDINYRAEIGPGFAIYHIFCTTFGSDVSLGSNITIVHGVTIAGKNGNFPTINDNVYIGAGACVLGDVIIGKNAVIGANAVVTKSVPENAVVVGNPAKIVAYTGAGSSQKNLWDLS